MAEAIQRVLSVHEAQRIDGGGDIEDEFAPAGRLEIEHRDLRLTAEQDVIGEQVAVDNTLGQLGLQVTIQVVDLVVKGAGNPAKIWGQPVAYVVVEIRDALETEAVVDALLIALADNVQFGQRAADDFKLSRAQPVRRD